METFASNITYLNRYRNAYQFIKVQDNVYTIKGDLEHWRIAGHKDDYAFVDPSGGPFLSVGHFKIDGKKCIKISPSETGLFNFEVET